MLQHKWLTPAIGQLELEQNSTQAVLWKCHFWETEQDETHVFLQIESTSSLAEDTRR